MKDVHKLFERLNQKVCCMMSTRNRPVFLLCARSRTTAISVANRRLLNTPTSSSRARLSSSSSRSRRQLRGVADEAAQLRARLVVTINRSIDRGLYLQRGGVVRSAARRSYREIEVVGKCRVGTSCLHAHRRRFKSRLAQPPDRWLQLRHSSTLVVVSGRRLVVCLEATAATR